jgi:basic membrane protein A and related proteins
VLTSMVKGVDAVVFDQITRVREGTFKGGVYEYGLAEQGVGYVYDARVKNLIPNSVRTKLEMLKRDIIAGRITVPSTR